MAGVDNHGAVLDSAELYDPNRGTWTATRKMISNRIGSATVLSDGKVLVAGSCDSQTNNGSCANSLLSAEVYDPHTHAWTAASSLPPGSGVGTPILLHNGQVLVAGGTNGNSSVANAELYDPVTDTWNVTASLNTPRSGHTATLLQDGRVLVAGGCSDSNCDTTPFISTELYSSSTSNGGPSPTPNPSPTDSGNEIKNPGFETGSLSGWTCTGHIALDTNNAHGGHYALAISAGTNTPGTCSQTVPVRPHTEYTFSGHVKASNGLDARMYAADEMDNATTSPSYVTQNGTLITGNRQTSVTLVIGSWDGRVGTAYYDDLFFGSCIQAWSCADIGGAQPSGGQGYDGIHWEVIGGGKSAGNSNDQYHFLYRHLSGNGSVRADAVDQDPTDPSAKAGVMIRQSLDPRSPFYYLYWTPASGVAIAYRRQFGGPTIQPRLPSISWDRVRLMVVRQGDEYSAFLSNPRIPWTELRHTMVQMHLPSDALIGVAVTSYNTQHINVATFLNVAVSGCSSIDECIKDARPSRVSSINPRVLANSVAHDAGPNPYDGPQPPVTHSCAFIDDNGPNSGTLKTGGPDCSYFWKPIAQHEVAVIIGEVHSMNWMQSVQFNAEDLQTNMTTQAINYSVDGNIGPFKVGAAGAFTWNNTAGTDTVLNIPHLSKDAPPEAIRNLRNPWWRERWATRVRATVAYYRYRLIVSKPCPYYNPGDITSSPICADETAYEKVVVSHSNEPGYNTTIGFEYASNNCASSDPAVCEDEPFLDQVRGVVDHYKHAQQLEPGGTYAVTYSTDHAFSWQQQVSLGLDLEFPITAHTKAEKGKVAGINVNVTALVQGNTDTKTSSGLTINANPHGPGGCIYSIDPHSHEPAPLNASLDDRIYAAPHHYPLRNGDC